MLTEDEIRSNDISQKQITTTEAHAEKIEEERAKEEQQQHQQL